MHLRPLGEAELEDGALRGLDACQFAERGETFTLQFDQVTGLVESDPAGEGPSFCLAGPERLALFP
jgi:hypothetical protein